MNNNKAQHAKVLHLEHRILSVLCGGEQVEIGDCGHKIVSRRAIFYRTFSLQKWKSFKEYGLLSPKRQRPEVPVGSRFEQLHNFIYNIRNGQLVNDIVFVSQESGSASLTRLWVSFILCLR